MTYDHITNQFNRDLSPLARRMYAAIWGTVSDPRSGLSVEVRHLDKTNEKAMMELIKSGLIEVVLGTTGHRRLTSAAWRAHLLAERAEKEQITHALRLLVELKNYREEHGKDEHYEQHKPEVWNLARAALSGETDEQALLRGAVEGRR